MIVGTVASCAASVLLALLWLFSFLSSAMQLPVLVFPTDCQRAFLIDRNTAQWIGFWPEQVGCFVRMRTWRQSWSAFLEICWGLWNVACSLCILLFKDSTAVFLVVTFSNSLSFWLLLLSLLLKVLWQFIFYFRSINDLLIVISMIKTILRFLRSTLRKYTTILSVSVCFCLSITRELLKLELRSAIGVYRLNRYATFVLLSFIFFPRVYIRLVGNTQKWRN